MSRAAKWYQKYVLDRPVLVILGLIVVISILGYQARNFKVDASAETLLLESDPDLLYARQISARYGSNDFLIVAYVPKEGDLFSEKTLKNLHSIKAELEKLERVSSVLSILDVPLFESPPLTYAELSEGARTLESTTTDRQLARVEFRESPFYRDLLVSRDMQTIALVVNLKQDEVYRQLVDRRNGYLEKRDGAGLTPDEDSALESTVKQIRVHLDRMNAIQHRDIAAVRAIMDRYRDGAELYLGGVSMIADDMISFIKMDLKGFGLGVFFLLVVMLGFIFRRVRWVVLPMLCCFLSVIAMMGILGTFGWAVTVISSNFISLQLIITLAIVVHLIVRYREFQAKEPQTDQRTLVAATVRAKFTPCLYAALTTIAGFSSLLFCDIKPVIHFGWMMSAGILVSLILTFILFPALVVLLPAEKPAEGRRFNFAFISFLADFTRKRGSLVLALTAILSLLTVAGLLRLVVENSFIDYFKKSTEIYRGMRVIDQKLGGTTPLDIIVRFEDAEASAADADQSEEVYLDDEEDAEFMDLIDEELEEQKDKYWFIDERLETIERVHDYLDALPETGKVLSFGTLLKLARSLRKGEALDSFEMNVFYTKLPDEYKDLIITPYVSFEANEARFSVRIKDSLKTLKRDALLKQIRHDLINVLHLHPDRVRIAGAMVLYNNMLQSLFTSQIKTIGVVALALLLMFLVLFRSLKLALIALFPNLFASGAVLGVMGWLDIPLDMMTITIAAISIGIAVDDTIHYIYRFQEEIKKDRDYYQALYRCHGSIGHAMYYTSVTIIIGFSILVFSNFWPTIYFGLFTGLAMFIALVAALTLLPQLLVLFKPFGPGTADGEAG
ncbi:MAG: RND family transporter [Desulfobacterales bacterium]|nr:RND family transporter [Desulfobacterales bacterium]